jgi:hypothetical protein
MSEPDKNIPGPPKDGSDAPTRGDALALGIGCLVTLLLFAALAFFGLTRTD